MKCDCFGESGLQGSTHAGADGERCCDLCGWPIAREAAAPFDREDRYIVIKRKQLQGQQEWDIRDALAGMGIEPVECVVVEADWPEYEQVWQMIEARCAK
jgi:hypothetical protein